MKQTDKCAVFRQESRGTPQTTGSDKSVAEFRQVGVSRLRRAGEVYKVTQQQSLTQPLACRVGGCATSCLLDIF